MLHFPFFIGFSKPLFGLIWASLTESIGASSPTPRVHLRTLYLHNYISQKVYAFILHIAIEYRYSTIITHALLSFQAIVGYEKVRRCRREKERRLPT